MPDPVDLSSPTSSATRYDTYTDSGVDWLGPIPAYWETIRLKHAIDLNLSKSEVRCLPDDREVSFVPMEAIHESGGLDLVETKELGDVIDGYTFFRENDVLVAKITPCFENRKGALAKGLKGGIGFGTTELHVLRPTELIDRKFLYYSTMSVPFRKQGAAVMYGAGGQKRIPDDFIENLRWPLPPPDEQRTIADFLDRATARIDTLIEKKERLVELLEEKRSALVSHVVTTGMDDDAEMQDSGVEWLGEIPVGWDVVRLKFLTSLVTSGPRGWAEYYSDDGPTFLQVGNLSRGSLDLDLSEVEHVDPPANAEGTRTRLQANDLLLSITAYIGSIGVVPSDLGEAYVNQHIALVRPLLDERAHSRWLGYCLLSQVGQSQFGELLYGGTKDGLSLQDVKDLCVLLPPLDEQRAIADHLDEKTAQIDALIERVRDGIERLREYRTALISAAVTGEIDVREAVHA